MSHGRGRWTRGLFPAPCWWEKSEEVDNITLTTVQISYLWASDEKLALHKALLFLGDSLISDNDENTAFNLYVAALEGFTQMDVHCRRAQCMLRLGDLANKQGNISMAIAYWDSARPLFELSSQTKDVARIDSRLSSIVEIEPLDLGKLATLSPPVEEISETGNVKDLVHKVPEDNIFSLSV
ncbi:hypothetical protein K438DRAFT_2145836 [Mycena galopus ATCC 62051]|nr:hypothetical protein K438DRAFT_2145836 [Mycena galopus ATCC 62051]